jgi:hypothetical protein
MWGARTGVARAWGWKMWQRGLSVGSRTRSILLAETPVEAAPALQGMFADVTQRLALVKEAEGEGVEAQLQSAEGDPALESMARARAAMMLFHMYQGRNDYAKALQASLAAKAAAEDALGPRSLEYSTALHAQATCLYHLGKHHDAARVLSYGAGLIASVSNVLAVRLRHQAAWHLAVDGQFDTALHALRDLRNHLEREHGEDHVSRAIASANMARVNLLSGPSSRVEEASAGLQEAFHALNRHLGRSHPFARQAYHLWAVCEVQLPAKEQILSELRSNLPL